MDDLQYQRLKCAICEQNTPSQVLEPLIITQPPGYQFQQTVADWFQLNNQNYLVYADRLTGSVEMAYLAHGVTSNNLIRMFQQYSVRWGSPKESATDRGTNLTSDEVNGFPKRWSAVTRVTSAHYQQSNGYAEAGVHIAKRILGDNTSNGGTLDTDKMAPALLQYLNTLLDGEDTSPVQLDTGGQL